MVAKSKQNSVVSAKKSMVVETKQISLISVVNGKKYGG